MKIRFLLSTLLLSAAGLAAVPGASAQTARVVQTAEAIEWCEAAQRGRSSMSVHCEVREITLLASRSLDVNAGASGGIRVEGGAHGEVRVLARVTAQSRDAGDARALAEEVRVVALPGSVEALGPRTLGRESWSVGFRIDVPERTDLRLRSTNGSIVVRDVHGTADVQTTNGGITLERLAGDVRGRTTNGGARVELAGTAWEGAGLEVRTTNGSVRVRAPEGYSADVEARTTNGSIRTDFPLTVQGRVGRRLEGRLGDGGAPIRLRTTNGSVRLQRGQDQ
jgi:hypothetical protein